MSAAVPTDESLIIETPERVPLHFALASIGNRFLACAFDHFLQIVVMLVVLLLLLWLGDAAGWYTRLRDAPKWVLALLIDRKSTRLNSSHVSISYAVFCLKKKKIKGVEELLIKNC